MPGAEAFSCYIEDVAVSKVESRYLEASTNASAFHSVISLQSLPNLRTALHEGRDTDAGKVYAEIGDLVAKGLAYVAEAKAAIEEGVNLIKKLPNAELADKWQAEREQDIDAIERNLNGDLVAAKAAMVSN